MKKIAVIITALFFAVSVYGAGNPTPTATMPAPVKKVRKAVKAKKTALKATVTATPAPGKSVAPIK